MLQIRDVGECFENESSGIACNKTCDKFELINGKTELAGKVGEEYVYFLHFVLVIKCTHMMSTIEYIQNKCNMNK